MVLPLLPVGREGEQWDTEQAGTVSAGPYEASRTGGEDPKLRFLGGRGEVEVSRRLSPGLRYGSLEVWTDGRLVPPGFQSVTLVSCVSWNKSWAHLGLTCPGCRVEVIITCVPNAYLRRDAYSVSHTDRLCVVVHMCTIASTVVNLVR